MNAIEVRGVSGEVRKGYRPVARLVQWSLAGGRLHGTITDRDDLTLSLGGPYRVVLSVGKQQWVWSDVDVSVEGASVSATVSGSPEVR